MVSANPDAAAQFARLAPLLLDSPGFPDVVAALQAGRGVTVDGAWGSSSALVVSALTRVAPNSIVVVMPRERELDDFAADLRSFGIHSSTSDRATGRGPEIAPAWQSLPRELSISDPILGNRLRVVRSLESDCPPRVVLTTIQALLQPVPSSVERKVASRLLKVGDELDQADLAAWLVSRGFERVTALEVPGEFSIHGGIVDIFPPDSPDPVRIELFGDEIESIRLFDVETQRKVASVDEIAITILSPADTSTTDAPTSDNPISPLVAAGDHILDSLPAGAWVVLVEMEEVIREGRQYLERLSDPKGLFSVDSTMERFAARSHVNLAPLVAGTYATTCHLQTESIERFGGPKGEALRELERVVQKDETVLIACHNEAARLRLTELLAEIYNDPSLIAATAPQAAMAKPPDQPPPLPSGPPLRRFLRKPDPVLETPATSEPVPISEPEPVVVPREDPFQRRVLLCVGHVTHGFRLVAERIVVLSDNELFARTEVQRAPRKKRVESRAIDSFLDLAVGDLVVHLSHGISRFRGMELQKKGDVLEEHLVLEFADGLKMYVPTALIHLVQKYVGGAKASPELSKIGGTSWTNKKRRVAEAVGDMAADMLKLQAERDQKPGLACPPDSHWMEEFEAEFPYNETDDQLRSIAELKDDMQRPRPMDRLICGDVGYGKTEVAMRAAFKAVDAGRQVAVLVPTTVLCEQHYRSFCERMAEFPVSIASLNRFRSPAETRDVLSGLAAGTIDIVIGTHRLVSKDVKFKELGLLVIDEEQRFGVETKELLKHLRLEVDVLTLSATPIPRTLHMSLVGIRDISNLETPPQDRMAVETRVCRWDGGLIRSAIIRELNRNGQIYFVHNRVYDIQSIADKIHVLVPEAKIDIVHGQMDEHSMEAAMVGFVEGRTDILVATTIIESGLDIPNANTIFIHQAGNYGLSDLHQLRGRVGRYKNRAYCYLLLEEGKMLTPQASRRLKAIEEFSELGAGFKIAMRDLEIRGAGNILGTEQSGHIASVGYELYCQLLENAVRAMKRLPIREHRHVEVALPVSAFLPPEYVPDGRPKIEMYRKLSGVSTLDDLTSLKDEFRDRFGPLPDPAEKLFQIRELQLLAMRWQIHDIHMEPGYVILGYRNPKLIAKLGRLTMTPLRILDTEEACLVLPPTLKGPKGLLRLLKEVLQASPT
ncbi:MAG: transcription-repair coupling factor [Planctomycetes bacterium]|nr:transcription-repair coupling factor [Planctomycetota bacterium]